MATRTTRSLLNSRFNFLPCWEEINKKRFPPFFLKCRIYNKSGFINRNLADLIHLILHIIGFSVNNHFLLFSFHLILPFESKFTSGQRENEEEKGKGWEKQLQI